MGAGDIQTTTQTLLADVYAAGKVSVPASFSLQSSGARFGMLTGSLTVSYWARTSSGGGGAVTVEASEFSPSGGPVAASVTYTCSGASLGTGCSGNQSLSTTTQTSVVSLPDGACTGGGCSGQTPNTAVLNFCAPSMSHYKTGTYTAQLMFTISTM